MAELTASARALTYRRAGGAERSAGTVDVVIDGHRVWTVTPDSSGDRVRLGWPGALRPYLRGRGRVEVRDATTGSTIAAADVRFRGSPAPLRVRDSADRPLVVTKWNVMGRELDPSPEARERLLDRTQRLLEDLAALGYPAYITGGTLLGAVRSGDILPRDDDTDLGVLFEHSSPADLVLDSFALEDQLAGLGYTVVRHAASHLQVTFAGADGRTDQYVDLFAAFYRGPHEFCQPIHVRADLPREKLLPLTTVTLAGRPFAANRDPEAWLAVCYGDDWRTPDPAWKFETPAGTRRRFENWFGSFNFGRQFWEAYWSGDPIEEPIVAAHRGAVERVAGAGGAVLDLGTGSGALARALADAGHPVIGVDYSLRALGIARATASGVDWRLVNLADRRRLLELAAELVTDGRAWTVSAANVLEGLIGPTRSEVLFALRLLGAPVVATVDTEYAGRDYSFDDPRSWHLAVADLAAEAAEHGFRAELAHAGRRRTALGRRAFATVVLYPGEPGQRGERSGA